MTDRRSCHTPGLVAVCKEVNQLIWHLSQLSLPLVRGGQIECWPTWLHAVKAERFHLCRVAGNRAQSHVAGDSPQLWDGFPIGSIYTSSTLL